MTPTICPLVFHRKGKRIKSYRKAWQKACEAAGCPGRLMHDFRRTAFAISSARACRAVWRRQSRGIGEAVYRRYAIVSSGDLADASRKLQGMTGTMTGTIGLVTDNTQNAKATAVERLRAPSSVVEHVTFNHGVPGSIPGGPIPSSSFLR